MGIKLAINASRARSGGARSHILGILSNINPYDYGFSEVHIWSYQELLDQIPERDWLIKHCPLSHNKSILSQLYWEYFKLKKEIATHSCSILFNVDAGTLCRFSPNVTMSQDMLSFEPGEIKRYGWSYARLRLIVLRWVQKASLRKSEGAIFLTHYAAKIIESATGTLRRKIIISHGIGKKYHKINIKNKNKYENYDIIECLYVSNTAPYKHQWHVVKAIEILRKKGYSVRLTLIGGGDGLAQDKLIDQIKSSDPNQEFIFQLPFIPNENIPHYLSNADVFVFASSCENMPITLLESMAAGLPIACSSLGPMPEVLADAGVYFHPENPYSIASAIEKLLIDVSFRCRLSEKAKELSRQYTWEQSAHETFNFIMQILALK